MTRESYLQIYFCAPQEATEVEWLAICKEAYKNRRTVGFSYDDAGIGKLAILYGIPEGQRQDFIDWFALYYKGTQVEFKDIPSSIAENFMSPVGTLEERLNGKLWE